MPLASSGEKGSWSGGKQVRLTDVNTGRLLDWSTSWYAISNWLQTWSGSVSGNLCITQTDQLPWKGSLWDLVCISTGRSGWLPIHTFQEHLTCFSNVKSITFHTLELVQQVGGFRVSKDGGEIGWGCGWNLFCSGFGCKVGILSRWWGMRTKARCSREFDGSWVSGGQDSTW